MVRVNVIFCAEFTIRDGDTNALSAINLLDDIRGAPLPFLIPRVSIVTLLERDANDPPDFPARMTIRLDGQQLFTGNFVIAFGDRMRIRNVTSLQGLVVPGPGVLRFELFRGDGQGQTLGATSITVSAGQPQQVQPAAPG